MLGRHSHDTGLIMRIADTADAHGSLAPSHSGHLFFSRTSVPQGYKCPHNLANSQFTLCLQPCRHLWSKVCNNDICPCPPNPRQHLHRNTPFVDPPVLSSSLNHRELAADIVGSYWQVTMLTDSPNHVQVSEGGLDHDDIGSFR